jgi:hypothetical protein
MQTRSWNLSLSKPGPQADALTTQPRQLPSSPGNSCLNKWMIKGLFVEIACTCNPFFCNPFA